MRIFTNIITIIFLGFFLSSCFSQSTESQAKQIISEACSALSQKDRAKGFSDFENLIDSDYRDRLGDRQKILSDFRELFFSTNIAKMKKCRFLDPELSLSSNDNKKRYTVSGIFELETSLPSNISEGITSFPAELYFFGQMNVIIILKDNTFLIEQNFFNNFREAYHLLKKKRDALEKKNIDRYLETVSTKYDFNGKTFEDIKKKIVGEFHLEREIQITLNRLEISYENPHLLANEFFSLRGIIIDEQVSHRGKGSYLLGRENHQSELKIVGGIF